jgi:hypothetical protein
MTPVARNYWSPGRRGSDETRQDDAGLLPAWAVLHRVDPRTQLIEFAEGTAHGYGLGDGLGGGSNSGAGTGTEWGWDFDNGHVSRTCTDYASTAYACPSGRT